jgi:ACS family allantoate permease-like MFS transporter
MANTSGHSKKLTMNAVFFISYCCGPQLFQANDAPDYAHGYIGLLACIVVAMLAIAAYGFVCARENARRDKVQAANSETNERAKVEAFSDMTEKEKPAFRYVY